MGDWEVLWFTLGAIGFGAAVTLLYWIVQTAVLAMVAAWRHSRSGRQRPEPSASRPLR